MNQILEKQNQEPFLTYLAAQRQIYNEEKRWISAWMVITTLVALVGSGSLAFFRPLTAYVTLGAALVIFGEIVILWIINKRGSDAACIQELFDCELLELPWNEIKVKKPEQELIVMAAARFRKHATPDEIDKLKDWYSKRITDMPLLQARIACQEENLVWDEKQRREYILWITAALIITGLITAVISIAANWPAQEFFTGPVLLILPVFGVGAKHIYDHFKATQRLRELNTSVKALWAEATQPGSDPEVIARKSRQLQDEIYTHRSENPPVFNWFYELIRKRYEKMRQG